MERDIPASTTSREPHPKAQKILTRAAKEINRKNFLGTQLVEIRLGTLARPRCTRAMFPDKRRVGAQCLVGFP